MSALGVTVIVWPFASALLLTVRWAGRALRQHIRPRRTAKP
ncbi:hypothetical protein [Streptomyces sp. bgisy031]